MSTDLTALTAHQFFQGVCWLPTNALAAAPAVPPAAVQVKLEALCQILQTLRAADSGWPAYKPQTPEYLLPYVTDEVEELLEALQSSAIAPPPIEGAAAEEDAALVPQLLGTLSTEWVWAIAASQPTAMTLLEGGAASSHDWPAAYGVRLVPVLIIHIEKADYSLDLTTQSLSYPTTEFAPSAHLQLLDEVTAPSASAADWKHQIQARSVALAPHLGSWYAGQTVDLGLPGASWLRAQARLDLRLVPLTVQASPALAAPSGSLSPEADGLPTARVWQADAKAAIDFDITFPAEPATAAPAPWTLDTELTFVHPEALTTALQALHRQDSQQSVMAHWQAAAAVTPMSLLTTVMETFSPAEAWGVTEPATALSLATLCTQVKWLWIRAHQGQVALMSGLPARRLKSGELWESGILTTQGTLVFLTADRPLATLDVATAAWTSPATDLQAADLIQLTAPAAALPIIGSGSQFTQTVNQIMRSRSPLLASLMAGQPIKLWSPQDELFPEATPPELQLRFQVGLTFFASLP